MNQFEFLQYDEVKGEKFLGIATVRCWGKIILRYKIIPTKEGNSFFAAPAGLKNGEKYESSFMLDSNYENQQLMNLIRDKVTDFLSSPVPADSKGSTIPRDEEECPF